MIRRNSASKVFSFLQGSSHTDQKGQLQQRTQAAGIPGWFTRWWDEQTNRND